MDLSKFFSSDGSQDPLRNFQYIMQSFVRLAFLEGDLSVASNTDGTVTVRLQDDRAGEKPLSRIVNFERLVFPQAAVSGAIASNSFCNRLEVEESIETAVSRAIQSLNISWERLDVTINKCQEFEDTGAIAVPRPMSSLNVFWKHPETTSQDSEDTVEVSAIPKRPVVEEMIETKVEENHKAVTTRGNSEAVKKLYADWTPQELGENDVVQRKPRRFCYRVDGQICSNCNVIKCPDCPFLHEVGRCFATGKECNGCGKIGHYVQKCPERREREWKRK